MFETLFQKKHCALSTLFPVLESKEHSEVISMKTPEESIKEEIEEESTLVVQNCFNKKKADDY